MQDIKARIDEFKKMAAFADQLEDAGDDRRAQAVRIALYDRVQDTTKIVEARIQEKFGGVNEMMRMASSDGDAMTKAAGFWGGLLDTLKGVGKAIGKGEVDPTLARKVSPGMASRLFEHLGRATEVTTPSGNILPAAAAKLSPLGRGLAIGVPAAGVVGAGAALAGRGRGPEQRPGEGLPPDGGGYPRGPATLPPSGMPPSGMPTHPVPPSWMPPSWMPPSGMPPMGGGAAEAMSAIQGVQSKLAELEGRIARLEAGGR